MDRNLALVREWEHLYNTDRNRLFDSLYAAECRVVYNGVLEFDGREALRAYQAQVDEHAPHRALSVKHVHATGDIVVVETLVFLEPAAPVLGACVVLTFRDGEIVEDRTYAPTGA